MLKKYCAYCGKIASISASSLKSKIVLKIIEGAQRIYDEWDQNEDGIDEVYGGGGVCDEIADEICEAVQAHTNLEASAMYNEYDTHTSVYAWDTDLKKLFHIDIPPEVYETGYGYSWRKNKDITFSPSDLLVEDISEEWSNFFDEDNNFIS